MRAIMVMYDTLCRHFLPPYAPGSPAIAPNFARLAQRTAQFQRCYVGSMPCIPARQEIHTGRYNFLHRGWGPLEGFDASMPEQLARAGIHTHLVTDHQHYWEDGGSTYHNRYSTYEFVRGQEGDRFFGWAGPIPDRARCGHRPVAERCTYGDTVAQDWMNRTRFASEADMPQTRTFDQGLDFIRRNAGFDGWFCQLETFDPHEPFFTQQAWQSLYPHDWDERVVADWPRYGRVEEDPRFVTHMRAMYLSLLSMCDRNLGRVLDLMDERSMWDDTMLIVNTDHGFLLGEHDFWAKCVMPFYQEVAHIPLWIWDPRSRVAGQRRDSLVQTIDLAPTLLDFFGQPAPDLVQGHALAATIRDDRPVRQAALFGIFGGHVNWTDGRHVYMRAPPGANQPLVEYTTMPCHMRSRYGIDELRSWHRHPGFAHTRGCPVPAYPRSAAPWIRHEYSTMLWDVDADPGQRHPLRDAACEARIIGEMVRLMAASDAPPEQYERLGVPDPSRADDAAALAAATLLR